MPSWLAHQWSPGKGSRLSLPSVTFPQPPRLRHTSSLPDGSVRIAIHGSSALCHPGVLGAEMAEANRSAPGLLELPCSGNKPTAQQPCLGQAPVP